MGRPALPRRARDAGRRPRDRLALRRARADGVALRHRRTRRSGVRRAARARGRPRRWMRSRSPARCCSRRAPAEIERRPERRARARRSWPPTSASSSVRFEPLLAGTPGRHALDRARFGGRQPRASFAAATRRGRRWAASRARYESDRERRRGRVHAGADAGGRDAPSRSTSCSPTICQRIAARARACAARRSSCCEGSPPRAASLAPALTARTTARRGS